MPRMSAARSGGTVLTAVSGARRAPQPGVRGSTLTHNKPLTCGDVEWFSQQVVLRSQEEIARLLAGFDLVEPGLVTANEWRPRRGRPGPAVPVLAGVGRLREPDASTGIGPVAIGSGDGDDVH